MIFCGACFHKLADNILKLLTKENGNNGRRCLIRTKSQVISDIRCTLTKQVGMLVDRLHDAGEHQKEPDVALRGIARINQVHPGVGRQRPVVVLSGAVDPVKRLLMKQAAKAVMVRHALHRLHDQLVMVRCKVCCLINRSQLMLRRCNLIVLRLRRNAELPELLIQILHVFADAFANDSEVMILHLLSLRSRCPEQGAPCKNKIRPLQIFLLVNQEVLLLRSCGCRHLGCGGIAEQTDNPECFAVNCLHGTKERRLLVECLSRIGAENRRNAERHSGSGLLQKCRACHVPCGVASCLERRTESSGREGGCIRFSLDQIFSGKSRHHAAFVIRSGNERIVLLRRNSGQRLKPVCIVRRTVFHCPVLHGLGYNVCIGAGELTAALNDTLYIPENAFGKALPHFTDRKDILAVQLLQSCSFCFHSTCSPILLSGGICSFVSPCSVHSQKISLFRRSGKFRV